MVGIAIINTENRVTILLILVREDFVQTETVSEMDLLQFDIAEIVI